MKQTLAPLALLLVAACSKEPAATTATPTATTSPSATAQATATASAEPTASAAPTATASAQAASVDADPLVGKPAPDFTMKTQSGKELHLAALKGKPVVLYFYPKDETPGCTKEACAFRDGFAELAKTGVVLVGVSTDTDASHKAFAAHHKLPFDFVSDPDGALATKFGVPMYPGEKLLKRQTIVIAPDGTVKKVYRQVDVAVHANEILADVKGMTGS